MIIKEYNSSRKLLKEWPVINDIKWVNEILNDFRLLDSVNNKKHYYIVDYEKEVIL